MSLLVSVQVRSGRIGTILGKAYILRDYASRPCTVDAYSSIVFDDSRLLEGFVPQVANCAAKLFEFAAAAAAVDMFANCDSEEEGRRAKYGAEIDAELANARRWIDIIVAPGNVPSRDDPRYVRRAKKLLNPESLRGISFDIMGARKFAGELLAFSFPVEDLSDESDLVRLGVASFCAHVASAALFMIAARPTPIPPGSGEGSALDRVRLALDSLADARSPALRFAD